MNAHDVLALLCASLVLLWWWPTQRTDDGQSVSRDEWNEIRGLRYLVAHESTAQSFTQSLATLDEVAGSDWASPALRTRLEVLKAMNAEAGIPVAIPLEQLHFECDTDEILARMWAEKSAVAYTSSNALVGISLVMLLLSGAASWVVSSPIGYVCVMASVALVFVTRRILKKLRTQSLTPVQSSQGSRVPMTIGLGMLSLGLVALIPNALGVAMAILSYLVLKHVLVVLPKVDVLRRDTHLLIERDWLLSLVHSATSAGHDWLKCLEIAQPHMSMEMQESIKPVVTRLRWGLPAVEAFADGMWRELAHLVQQVQQLGIKSDSALGNLRLDLNHTHRSRRISRLESLAAKSVIPVSLLQLPAFILIGIVPAVANQFSSLLTTFLPFNS